MPHVAKDHHIIHYPGVRSLFLDVLGVKGQRMELSEIIRTLRTILNTEVMSYHAHQRLVEVILALEGDPPSQNAAVEGEDFGTDAE